MYMVGRRKGRLCRRSWKRSPNGGRTKMVPYSSGTCSCRKKVGRPDKGSRTRKLKESRMRGTAWTYQRTTNDPSRGRQDGPGAKAKGKEGTCRLYVTTHENPGVIGFARRRIIMISRRLNGSCTIKTTSIV